VKNVFIHFITIGVKGAGAGMPATKTDVKLITNVNSKVTNQNNVSSKNRLVVWRALQRIC